MQDLWRKLALKNRKLPIKQRQYPVGHTASGIRVYTFLDTSFIIGGLPGQGKSTIAAWLACMGVLVGGELMVIDPHMHHEEESLYARISPLQRWFSGPPISFDEDEIDAAIQFIEWLEQEYKRRKAYKGMQGKKPLMVIIDEFNELLDDLPEHERKFACKIIKQLLRGGRKHGIICVLIAQNWDLESTGGRAIRTNTGCKIVTPADISEYKLVLGIDDDRAKALPPIRKGQAHVYLKNRGKLLKLCYPNTTPASCAALAREIAKAEEETAHSAVAQATQQQPAALLALPSPLQRITEPFTALLQPAPDITTTTIEAQITQEEEQQQQHHPHQSQQQEQQEKRGRKSGEVSTVKQAPEACLPGKQQVKHQVKQEQIDELVRLHLKGESHRDIAKKIKLDGPRYDKKYKPLYQSLGIPSDPALPMNDAQWLLMKQYYGFRCLKCGVKENGRNPLQRDHIIPRSWGGPDAVGNRQPLCAWCNKSKGDTEVDYRREARM